MRTITMSESDIDIIQQKATGAAADSTDADADAPLTPSSTVDEVGDADDSSDGAVGESFEQIRAPTPPRTGANEQQRGSDGPGGDVVTGANAEDEHKDDDGEVRAESAVAQQQTVPLAVAAACANNASDDEDSDNDAPAPPEGQEPIGRRSTTTAAAAAVTSSTAVGTPPTTPSCPTPSRSGSGSPRRAFPDVVRLLRQKSQNTAPTSSTKHATREVSHGLWIIWLGVGISACLASLGYHWIISQSALWICGLVWAYFNVPLSEILRSLFFTAAAIFFKDFDVAGAHRVPAEGPVLLVCGPHANQFIDPIVVGKALHHRKDIGFISAASTMRKKCIGAMAAAMGSIPVERAQDIAKVGTGTVQLALNDNVVKGVGTKFLKDFEQPNASLAVKVPAADGKTVARVVRVAEVLSDTRLRLVKPLLDQAEESVDDIGNRIVADPENLSATFKIFPRIDLADTFTAVNSHLQHHCVVGIFPEGGSHDQTKMLPLKA